MVDTLQENPDVIVIGGGPAGSSVATLIAQKGYRVELFEREHFPRFHIGESLIPQTYWVLKRLNMLEKMKASHFVKKYSVQFVNQHGKLSEPFYFGDHKPHESSQTWQVRRSDFDHMMIDNAREHGVQVHEGARVLEVLFEGQRAVGVRVRLEDGKEREVRAKVVVDASGQSSMIMDRLGLREWDPVLKKAALWTYWKGAFRDVGRDEGATVVIQTQGKTGWFWYIPLPDDVMSVGVVAAYDYLFKDRASKDYETIYFEEVARCPGVQQRINSATRCDIFRAAERILLSRDQGRGGRLGVDWGCLRFPRSALFLGSIAGVDLGRDGGRCRDGRVVHRRHFGFTTGQMGEGFQCRDGPDAPAGLRVLRWIQLWQVREETPGPERIRDRCVNRGRIQK